MSLLDRNQCRESTHPRPPLVGEQERPSQLAVERDIRGLPQTNPAFLRRARSLVSQFGSGVGGAVRTLWSETGRGGWTAASGGIRSASVSLCFGGETVAPTVYIIYI